MIDFRYDRHYLLRIHDRPIYKDFSDVFQIRKSKIETFDYKYSFGSMYLQFIYHLPQKVSLTSI